MKKLFLLAFTLFFIFSCDIGSGSGKKDDTQDTVVEPGGDAVTPEVTIDPQKDVSLKTVTVNGIEVDLSSGGTNFEFYLTSSGYPGNTTFEVQATTTNTSAIVTGGTGSNSVPNPIVAEAIGGVTEQESGEKLVVITVKSEDGTITKEYNLRIYSAPAWIRFPLKYSSEKNFKNKKAYFFLCYWGTFTITNYEYNTTFYNSKPKYFYMALPKEETIKYNVANLNVDINDNNDKGVGFEDINAYHENGTVNVSKSIINEIPMGDCSFVNRIEVINVSDILTSEYSDASGNFKTSKLYGKDVITGEIVSPSNDNYKITDNTFTFLHFNEYGEYELLLKDDESITENYNKPMVSLGVHNITDHSNIKLDSSIFEIKKVSDFALSIVDTNYVTKEIKFSEAVNKNSLESSLTICKELLDGSLGPDISFSLTMSPDNKTVTIAAPDMLETESYLVKINKEVKALSGNNLLEEVSVYF